MILIGPEHSNAAVHCAVDPDSPVEGIWERLREKMDQVYLDKFGAPVPEEWLAYDKIRRAFDGPEIKFLLRAVAPRRARQVYLPDLNEVRDLPMYASAASKIPITSWSYEFDRLYIQKSEHYVFRGWDLETGLMVFDR